MKILVTGGDGFIGRHLVNRLADLGHSIIIFDLNLNKDLRNSKQVDECIKKVDVVFHLAAVADLNWAREHSREALDINIQGTINIVESCCKYKVPLYFASTCCVYGNQKKHPTNEESLTCPSEIYAATKLAGENIIKGYSRTYGLKFNLMRFATIYGPGMRPALGMHIFFKQAMNNQPITVHGDGKQTRTLTYVTDLIDGIIYLFKSGLFLEEINISTEEEISANKMAEEIIKITNSNSKILYIDQRIGQTFKEKISAQKAKKLFNWKAKHSFKEGLLKTYKWFLNEDFQS